MRGMGLFIGTQKRNDNYELTDPRPILNYGNDVHTGDPAVDGYTLLSKADPTRQGSPPNVEGTEFPSQTHRGPDESFEQ